MYDFAFDHRTLARELVRRDFKSDPRLIDDDYRLTKVTAALEQASVGFTGFSLLNGYLRGKPTYQIEHLEHALVLRKFSRNIKKITKVQQSDRNTIIKSLKQLLSEGHHFRIYKLDLKNFYESIDRSGIEAQLRRDGGLAPPTLHVFQFIHTVLTAKGIAGLPRGLSVSAVLSEYAMRSFDQVVKSLDNVYYFARYVDDIVVITTGEENKKSFLKRIRKSLPLGVALNHNKTRILDFNQLAVNKTTQQVIEGELDFLGYRFMIHKILKDNRARSRKVYADISLNKIKRFKSRIILSALQFIKDRNYRDFRDRLRVLSGNYNVYDFDKKIRRNVGVFFNYRFLDLDSSFALIELDDFIKKLVLGRVGKISLALNGLLSPNQRRDLLKLSFKQSFTTQSFSYFEINRLTHLVGCWVYE